MTGLDIRGVGSRACAAGLLVVCVLLTSACGSSSPSDSPSTSPRAARSDDQVLLDFSGSESAKGGVDLTNSGQATTDQQVITAGSGALTPTDGPDDEPGAVRFPAYDGSGPPDWTRAIIAVTNAGSKDELSPGSGAFSYGADVRLDETSNGSPAYDNGNNILQRGLYTSGAQFKLQFDGANASCLIHGDDGDLAVKLPVPKESWYRLSCAVVPGTTSGKATDTLTLTAAPIDVAGSVGTPQTSVATGPVGTLDFPLSTPLSVGGKLSPELKIVTASDQFNGCVARAFLRLG